MRLIDWIMARFAPIAYRRRKRQPGAGTNVLTSLMAHGPEMDGDPYLEALVREHADMYVDGNAFKWKTMLGAGAGAIDDYPWTRGEEGRAEASVAYAESIGAVVKATTLLWSKIDFFPYDNATLSNQASRQAANEAHVSAVMSHFGERVDYIDLWNEPIDLGGDGLKGFPGVDPVTYAEIGSALDVAVAASPSTKFGINEHSCESPGAKQDELFALCEWLVNNGHRLDYVGFQAHLNIDEPIDRSTFEATFARFQALGIEVLVTELDVKIGEHPGTLSQRLFLQGELVSAIAQAAYNREIHSVGWWGVTDKYSWLYTADNWGIEYPQEQPLPFDNTYQPKAAWTKYRAALPK